MKIFQTLSGKKINLWHIYVGENDQYVEASCCSGNYWIGGYHNDKPKIRPEIVDFDDERHQRNLCPACVRNAYRDNLLKIRFND